MRPGTIVGPGERVGSLTYWAARMAAGGEVIAAGDPFAPIQLIDARDLAEWTIRSAERGQTGAFTAVGPATKLSWSETLGGLRAAFSVPTTLTWIPLSWLTEREIKPFSALLFWPAQVGIPGNMELKVDKAVAHGLTFRPLNTTVVDTVAWYRSLPPERRKEVLIRFDKDNRSLEDSMALEQKLLAAWHAREGYSSSHSNIHQGGK